MVLAEMFIAGIDVNDESFQGLIDDISSRETRIIGLKDEIDIASYKSERLDWSVGVSRHWVTHQLCHQCERRIQSRCGTRSSWTSRIDCVDVC